MEYQCCAKDKIRFEIESWYDDLKKNEEVLIKITKCDVLKGTFDLKITKQKGSDN